MPRLDQDPFLLPATIVSDRPMSENLTGNWRNLRPVIEEARCTGCLLCWKYCPEACVRLTDKVPEIELSYCKGCGICARECPPRSIALVEEAA